MLVNQIYPALVVLALAHIVHSGPILEHDSTAMLRARDDEKAQNAQAPSAPQSPNAQELQAFWQSQAQDMAKAGKSAPTAQQIQAMEEQQQAEAAKQGQQAPTADQLEAAQQKAQQQTASEAQQQDASKQAGQVKGAAQDLPFGIGDIFGGKFGGSSLADIIKAAYPKACYGGYNGEKNVCFWYWIAGCECKAD
ncbi:Hypothetical predicted protein [Lecanosticta acicola]|uniref:Uncharacterized protein n=1 Tax=Lecanosticta acicola TaxID=111012 RepID=A0AAI8YYA7_9PEZI|nr:Hypothetical predicted protein [Lecanosticta acicola]